MTNNQKYIEKINKYQALLEKKITLKKKLVQLEKENFGILNSFIKNEVKNS